MATTTKKLRAAPRQVQLPGGVILKAIPFKVIAYHDDGTPKLFEIQPALEDGERAEEWIRGVHRR